MIKSQFVACSGNRPVCLKDIGLSWKVSSLYEIAHCSGRRRISHLPPPEDERWYTAFARRQTASASARGQMACGSGRCRSWLPQRSSFSPPPQSSTS